MAGSGAWKRLKSLLRKDDAPLFLNDTSAFDFSDEVGDEGLSRFNKLRVVVADDGAETPERPVNGAHPALQADDDSLLDQDLPLTNSQLSLKVDPCDNCSKQRELLKQRKVKTRLTIAAVLYLLFMIGELVGGYIANSLAIMTDALHMLTDLSAIILTLLALWLSSKSPTKRFTFGFHRLVLVQDGGPEISISGSERPLGDTKYKYQNNKEKHMVGSPINKKFPEISGSWKVDESGLKEERSQKAAAQRMLG
ncbi:zinc transporter 4 isoform X2 [Camelus ferus]|uniref:Zinc transporter 4 isoform X2 n=3 Tax=Camelus TaxID=9836 RepID=A0A8B8T4G4_CAMFR|nr:zinc transporter 4 isoform X2 [Camelus ferus]XP_045380229.1 zinc transporter 4 isoform X2 [Camelus bactrianus]